MPDHRVAASGSFLAGDTGAAVASQPGGAVSGRLRAGVVLAVDALEGAWAHVLTPCENHVWVRLADGHIDKTADIVIDAGHGGPESGAVGQGGLTEKELNLAVARMVVDDLAGEGVTAALARTGDYRQTLASRVAVATAMHPKAFVSIHHNAEPDGPRPQGPGTETYYQTGKEVSAAQAAQSKRLAGLIYEEVVKALSAYQASWMADTDAGAKYRIGDSGNDYYGVLRMSGANGIVGSLAELAFISNPSEEGLLKRDDVRRAEAAAVARGIVRYLRTADPGSGFTTPYPARNRPAEAEARKAASTRPEDRRSCATTGVAEERRSSRPATQGPHLRRPFGVEGQRPGRGGRAQFVTEGAGGPAGQLGVGAGPGGQVLGPGLDGAVGNGLPGDAEVGGPPAGELVAEETEGRRRLPARRPPRQHEEPAAGVEADAEEAGQEPGIVGDDPEVGGEGQVDAGPHRPAPDGGHRRRLELADPGERPVDDRQVRMGRLAERVGAGAGQRVAVGPGAEVRSPGHHHGADVGVAVDLLAGLDQVGGHGRRQGVAAVLGGQGDDGDGAVDGKLDLAHRVAS